LPRTAAVRLDKWLWASRFYKTRSLATDAVGGGKVRLNGLPTKPAREVKLGDRIQLRTGDQDWEVVVQGFNEQRRPAPEARLLYAETAESVRRRALASELRTLAPTPAVDQKGRPTKRARRQLIRFHDG
jgi:ribosome-associated heat shock protein Hsp15